MKFFKNNFILKFTAALFIVGIIFGIALAFTNKVDFSLYFEAFKTFINSAHQNTFLYYLGVITAVFILSCSVVGVPIILAYIFYEGFTFGFSLMAFITSFKIKGLLFYSVFFLISKLIFIIVLIYFTVVSLKFAVKLVSIFTKKTKDELYNAVKVHFYRYIICFIVVLIYSIFIYFGANFLLKNVLFLIV